MTVAGKYAGVLQQLQVDIHADNVSSERL